MSILGKDTSQKMIKALTSDYYKEWVDYYTDVFRKTRKKELRTNKDALLDIQLQLAKNESKLWEMLRDQRNRAKKIKVKDKLTADEKKELAGLEMHIFIHKQIIRISKTICDGIAWRNTQYNDMFMFSSAMGTGPGEVSLTNKAFVSEFQWAKTLTEERNTLVILNDLTRFLRIGDLTEIDGPAIFLHEIKMSGNKIKVKNMFTLDKDKTLSQQEKRLLELQKIALTNKLKSKDKTIPSAYLSTPYKTYANKLKDIITQSEQEIVVNSDVEPHLNALLINYEKLVSLPEGTDIEKSLEDKLPKINPGELVITHSSWDTFYSDHLQNFLRTIYPYSIYPLNWKHCMNLISGQYLLILHLNVNKLKKSLINHGYGIVDLAEEKLDEHLDYYKKNKYKMFLKKDPIYEKVFEDPGLFKITKGPFSINLTANFYTRFTYGLMTFDCFLEVLDELYNKAKRNQKSDIYFPMFSNNKSIWN